MVRWNKAYRKGTQEIVNINDEFCKETEFECISCGEIMIARKGGSRKHHFAHKQTTNNCNPESYFHKLSKKLFKEIYEQSATYWIKNSFCEENLKDEYKQCLVEGRKGVYTADLLLKHVNDEKKDIFIEIFYTHQVSSNKLNEGYPIIEIRIPQFNKDTDSDEIERNLMDLFTPPLKERDEIRFYNFNENRKYNNLITKTNLNSCQDNDITDSLCSNININNRREFRNYIFPPNIQKKDTLVKFNNSKGIFEYTKTEKRESTPNVPKPKKNTPIPEQVLYLGTESIKNAITFDVTPGIKKKYPNISHQPAVLPNYRNILDIIIKDENKEYWLGINYNKTEVIQGDFDRKIPNKWKVAAKEYIEDLHIVQQ